MAGFKFNQGDLATVVDNKYPPYHFYPEGTVVRIGARRGKDIHHFSLYYCEAVDDGLKQLVPSHQLENIEN